MSHRDCPCDSFFVLRERLTGMNFYVNPINAEKYGYHKVRNFIRIVTIDFKRHEIHDSKYRAIYDDTGFIYRVTINCHLLGFRCLLHRIH